MGFSVERTKEKVTIYGETFEVRQPTVRDAIEMQRKAKESGSDETALKEMRAWAETLVPVTDRERWSNVIDDMETGHFLDLVTYLSQGQKKKQDLIAGSSEKRN